MLISLQASVITDEWRGAVELLGLVAGGMTLLGLVVNYLIVMNIRPVREQQYARDEVSAEVERYRKPARILHWVYAGAFVLLLITGIALFISRPGEAAPGGWVYTAHLVAGVVLITAPVIYFLLNRKSALKGIRYALTWGKADLEWLKAAPQYYYLCDEQALPPQGYLNTFQKMWLFLVIASGLVFAVSGLVLWVFGADATAELAQFMLFIHDIAFIAAGTMFLVHIYISVIHPMSYPLGTGGWGAITRGKVSADYARSHHAEWYEEVSRTRKT